jgi:hypothetical protein
VSGTTTSGTSTGNGSGGSGGVLGATATAHQHAHGGVLGATATVARTNLPFTGFPVWAVTLAAIGLLGIGLGLRRGADLS